MANEERSSFACLSISLNSASEPLLPCLSFRGRGFAALIEEAGIFFICFSGDFFGVIVRDLGDFLDSFYVFLSTRRRLLFFGLFLECIVRELVGRL